jgi:hypothetical protein
MSPPDSGSLVLARAREGRMRKLTTSTCTQFYGGTSLFQMQLSGATSSLPGPTDPSTDSALGVASSSTVDPGYLQHFRFQPKDETCRKLIAVFFQNCYPFNMYVYREWFLRDYDVGKGPYYSDSLMFAICAVGALVSPDTSQRPLSSIFYSKAEALVLKSLDLPDITILQALVMLGCLQIGQGRSSKGWLYCGMAFRLTHEMGLHLDPNNWKRSRSESSVDREILRRVYWAVFIVDKQLSMYFGRPPALYPHEADVKDTIRIPYPEEWERLLDMYVCKGTSPTAFEEGIPLVACFVHQVQLAKILHVMIVDVFENRRRQSAESTAAAAATAQQVHTSLVRWLSELPQKLHWNQWTIGQKPPYMLHIHMLFHTTMIILHRPPRQHLDDEAVINGEGLELCYQSLSAILKLLKSYRQYYRFEFLPLDFVQTLASAAEIVMIKRYIDKSSWDDKDISRPMAQILDAMEAIQHVSPSVREIRDSILQSIEAGSGENEQQMDDGGLDLDLVDLLQPGAGPFPGIAWDPDDAISVNSANLGFLVTDDFLNEHCSW